ncbi:DUF4232 domain-containing protein [Streptomyces sp. HB2AG]|uniref:DUF4232 domain-containing protein n=1 Tax=Streptomyces sp. HB2AG TaxID=2983400 RepID=UPI0022AA2E41|nr:DUF4232 domain-containing protein [Streptomyces sp. HB2AG]MCZ2523854.1 DUF4232 domain-containing protein [Streptomyces sp. HB2AG]
MNTTPAGTRRPSLPATGLLLTALGLLTACTTAPPHRPSPAPSRTSPSASACPESGLTVREGQIDAVMGLRVLTVELHNCGTRPRTVNGYPDVRVLDDDREPLDVETVHGLSSVATLDEVDTAPEPVGLEPGEKAVARLAWKNRVTDSTVPATDGSYLDIAPAEGEDRQTVEILVDLGTTGRLGTSAWGRPSEE